MTAPSSTTPNDAPSTLASANASASAGAVAQTDVVLAFHASFFSTFLPTPLHRLPTDSLPSLASAPASCEFYLKDESSRCGLPAFKVLGASHALCSVLGERWGVKAGDRAALSRAATEDGAAHGGEGLRVYAATDGNHGRAVAHTARLVGLESTIYVPSAVAEWSRAAIASEGAHVVVHDGDYDATVQAAATAAEEAGDRGLLIQDTSWAGYEDIPMRIVHGYTKLFHELGPQLGPSASAPTHIVVPVGVGSLAHAAVLYARSLPLLAPSRPRIITVEPRTAACLHSALLSAQAQAQVHPVDSAAYSAFIPEPVVTGATIMPGLCCGTVSPLAWPDLREDVRVEDALVISDDQARGAMRELEGVGRRVGPCGAAAMAGAAVYAWPEGSRVVLICTEGPEGR